jgi:pimeloyl-ACP methyl ester carboxylesterase
MAHGAGTIEELEVWVGGQGRPILFLHPGDGIDSSRPFIDRLTALGHVIAPSHPGFGGSSLPRHFSTVDDIAYFYLDYLEHQGLQDVVLVGVSFGAWIGAEIAIKSTDRLAGLVLIDAIGAKFGAAQEREIIDLFAYPQHEHSGLFFHNQNFRVTSYAGYADEDLAILARNNESLALFGWSPTLHDPKLAQRLHRIGKPTLVLWGAEDRITPPAYGRRFAAAIPGAVFELIPHAGHYAHVENPDIAAAAVRRFIATPLRRIA